MNDLTFLGSNINLVKSHNLRAILLSLLHEGSLSRVGLARKTGLSTTTVTNLIADLLEQGIVIEEGMETVEGPRPVGRPRTALRLVDDARYAIGVHIGIGRFRVGLANLTGDLVARRTIEYDFQMLPEAVLDEIVAAVQEQIQGLNLSRERLLGVGVGASGLVNHQTGVNVLAPNLGWHDVPVRDYLAGKLGLPVTIDNNVRAMALAEAFFGAGKGVNSLAFVYGRVGVGAGFVVGGQIFRGSSLGAGEIGHTILIAEGGERCRCGNSGCLETLVSEPRLISQAATLVRQFPNSDLARRLRDANSAPTIEHIFAAARAGDERVKQMIEQRACYLGMALANLVNILNPELILLGGLFAEGHDLILPVAEAKMREVAFAGLGDKVHLEVTRFGWQAGVLGAATMALMTYFYQEAESIP